jgi:hypothetical protein
MAANPRLVVRVAREVSEPSRLRTSRRNRHSARKPLPAITSLHGSAGPRKRHLANTLGVNVRQARVADQRARSKGCTPSLSGRPRRMMMQWEKRASGAAGQVGGAPFTAPLSPVSGKP